MAASLEPQVTFRQEPQVTFFAGTLPGMASTLRKRAGQALSVEEIKLGFAARLNELLDEAQVSAKFDGRQEKARALLIPVVGKISQKGVRKWLEGEALPEHAKLIQIAIYFDVNVEWLRTGRGDRGVKSSVSDRHRKLIDCYEKAEPNNRHIVDLALGL